jgi:hypothetical protein
MISVGEKKTNMYRLQLVILNKIDNIDRHHRRNDFFSQDSVNKKMICSTWKNNMYVFIDNRCLFSSLISISNVLVFVCVLFSNRIKSVNHHINVCIETKGTRSLIAIC